MIYALRIWFGLVQFLIIAGFEQLRACGPSLGTIWVDLVNRTNPSIWTPRLWCVRSQGFGSNGFTGFDHYMDLNNLLNYTGLGDYLIPFSQFVLFWYVLLAVSLMLLVILIFLFAGSFSCVNVWYVDGVRLIRLLCLPCIGYLFSFLILYG